MMKLSDYTTDELKRLSTLTLSTMRPMECFESSYQPGRVHMIVTSVRDFKDVREVLCCTTGKLSPMINFRLDKIRRRVTTMPNGISEIDPPIDVLQAELDRRQKMPKISNKTHAGMWVRSNTESNTTSNLLILDDAVFVWDASLRKVIAYDADALTLSPIKNR